MGGALFYDTFTRIGLMAVFPEIQHQGIGVAIMQQLLEWSANRGATTVLLDATPAGVPLYAKLGFITDDSACVYIQRRSSTLVDTRAISTKQLELDELPEVVMYDAERFGAQRARVLTSYYQAFPDRAFVALNDQGIITGYIIAQARRLGPWLADTPEIAEARWRPPPNTTKLRDLFSREPVLYQSIIGNLCVLVAFLNSTAADGSMDMPTCMLADMYGQYGNKITHLLALLYIKYPLFFHSHLTFHYPHLFP